MEILIARWEMYRLSHAKPVQMRKRKGVRTDAVRKRMRMQIDGGVQMDIRQNPYQEPSCPDVPQYSDGAQNAVPGNGSPLRADATRNGTGRTYSAHRMLKGAAGRAETSDEEKLRDVLGKRKEDRVITGTTLRQF